MASIFKRTYTYTHPQTGEQEKRKTKVWYIEYRTADGTLSRVKGYSDRKATEQLAARLERDAARGQVGMIDEFKEHRKKPLTDHLEAFKAHLEDKERTANHISLTVSRINKTIEETGFKVIGDIDVEKVERFLARQRKDGMSIQTSNHYVRCMKSFTAWLVRSKRIDSDALRHLETMNVESDRRHKRRSLTDDEFLRLIEATVQSECQMCGFSGQERAHLYIVASYTGLRASELASLTRSSFDLDETSPTVHIGAKTEKNRKGTTLPLHPALVPVLREWLDSKDKDAPVWGGNWAKNKQGGQMVKRDLKAAEIAYKVDGDVFDFHALRGQYAATLARSGVHPKIAQELLRHSNINLTMNTYTNLGSTDLQTAVESLPSPPTPTKTGESTAPLTGILTGTEVSSVQLGSPPCDKSTGQGANGDEMETVEEQEFESNGGEENGEDGIRTRGLVLPNHRFSKPETENHNPQEYQILTARVDVECREYCQDTDLHHLIEAWPHLPEHIKQAILTLVESTQAGEQTSTTSHS